MKSRNATLRSWGGGRVTLWVFVGMAVSVLAVLYFITVKDQPGAFWGFWLGFVVGWVFAFLRNLTLAITSFVFRARAELEESRGFLDHI